MTSGTTATSGGAAEPCKTVSSKTAVVVMREDWDRTTKISTYEDGWMGFAPYDDPWSSTKGPTRGPCMRWGSSSDEWAEDNDWLYEEYGFHGVGGIHVDDGRLLLVNNWSEDSYLWTADPLPNAPYCVVFSVDRFAMPGTYYDERAGISIELGEMGENDFPGGGFSLDIQRTDPAMDCWGGEFYMDVPNDPEDYNGNTTEGWYWEIQDQGNNNAWGYLPASFLPDVFYIRIEWAPKYSRVKIWSAEDAEPEAWTGSTSYLAHAEDYFIEARGFYLEISEWANPSARAIGPIVISAVAETTKPCSGSGYGWNFTESPGYMSVVTSGGDGPTFNGPTFDYSYTFAGSYPWASAILVWQSRSQRTVTFAGLVPHATYRFVRKCVVTDAGGWSGYLATASLSLSVHAYDATAGIPAYGHGGFTGGSTVYEGVFSPWYGNYGCEWDYGVETPWGIQDWWICGRSTGVAIDDDPRALTVDFEAVASAEGEVAIFAHLYQYDDWSANPPAQGPWGCSGGSFSSGCGPQRSYSVVWGATSWGVTRVRGAVGSVPKCGTDEPVPSAASTGGGSVMMGR